MSAFARALGEALALSLLLAALAIAAGFVAHVLFVFARFGWGLVA